LELLHGLPEDQREAIRARVIDDADYAEVAERLAISPAAARQRVSRGLATLRRTLQREGEQP
jgi:RNA polymerase sigma-70 factor (ECF subfamily)